MQVQRGLVFDVKRNQVCVFFPQFNLVQNLVLGDDRRINSYYTLRKGPPCVYVYFKDAETIRLEREARALKENDDPEEEVKAESNQDPRGGKKKRQRGRHDRRHND